MSQAASLGRVLVIAGSDSGGGAGVQADIKTITALGGYAATSITAVTVQNTLGVTGVHPIPLEFIAAQARAVLDDIGADAIKTGMLGDVGVVETVAVILEYARTVPVVVDPVMVAKGGASLLADAAIGAVKSADDPARHAADAQRARGRRPDGPDGRDHRRPAPGRRGAAGDGRQGGADEGRSRERGAGRRCADDLGRRDHLRGRADRHPPHPRHRLHAGQRLRDRPGPRPAAGAGRGAGLELCPRGHAARAGLGAGHGPLDHGWMLRK
jgi:hydroxymethylpyrimidine/phosphomethylpyrimidine kinase